MYTNNGYIQQLPLFVVARGTSAQRMMLGTVAEIDDTWLASPRLDRIQHTNGQCGTANAHNALNIDH